MDGVKYVRTFTPIAEVIEEEQPAAWMSCDWIRDPLSLGLVIFPLDVYRKMEALQNANRNGREQ